MSSTPNLGIAHISASQSQKEVTANTAFDTLDEAVAGEVVHNMASDANYTLDTSNPAREDEKYVTRITDSGVVLTATRDIYYPSGISQVHICINETAQALNFGVSGNTLVSVPASGKKIILIDSADDAEEIASPPTGIAFTDLADTPANFTGSGGYQVKVNSGETALEFVNPPVDVGVFFSGKPTNAQECLRFMVTRQIIIPDPMTASNASARVASTGNVDFSLRRNGVEFATVTFNISASGTFSITGAETFAENDILTILGPATADSTLEDINIVLAGTLE